MPRANTTEIRLVVFVPGDVELAVFIEDALAFNPVSLRVCRTLAETVAALREDRPHALIVDLDAMTPNDAHQLHPAIGETEWHGAVIAIGDPTPAHRESLHVDDVLGSKLTSSELRDTVARVAR